MADSTRKKPATRQPITSHPLFPAVVVLWFGALFGLVSVAIRPALIERLVHLTGIDSFIPMAAPPLGTTTRILLALLMTGLGCLLGALVARLVATKRAEPGGRRRPVVAEADTGSPIGFFGSTPSADDEQELEDDLPSREVLQRQLAPAAEEDDSHDEAPLPEGPQVLNVADLGPDLDLDGPEDAWVPPFRRTEPTAPRRLDPDGFGAEGAAEPSAARNGMLEFPAADSGSEPEQSDAKRNRLFEAYAGAKRVRPELQNQPAGENASVPGFASLVQNTLDADSPRDAGAVPRFDIRTPENPAPPHDLRQADRTTAAERLASAPLEQLSHVGLLERLALALERRRAAYARFADASVRAAAPFGLDSAEEEDEQEKEGERADGYSSLLDLSMRSVSRPLVESDSFESMEMPEPVVMFPAHQVTCVPQDESAPSRLQRRLAPSTPLGPWT